ncbi:MAG: hypothetical protein ACKO04_02135 [Actinomycetes bacterium]
MAINERTRTVESERARSTLRAATTVGVAVLGLLWLVAGQTVAAGASIGGTDHTMVICHVPPGNPANPHEIEVDAEGWKGHDHHPGDVEGPCPSVATTAPTTSEPATTVVPTTGPVVAPPSSSDPATAADTSAAAARALSVSAVESSIALHNASAAAAGDCPSDGRAYWHFVLAPNNGSSTFTSITLNLNGTSVTFTGAQIVGNGGQGDNVWVAVPAGYALPDLQTSGSSATYTGSTPTQFVLSHVCPGTVPTTTTTAPTTTVTTTEPATTTTAPTTTVTTTTTTEPTTTTTEPTTTTTEPTTTTTEPPVTVLGSTTIVEPTTTTEGPPPSVLGSTTIVDRPTTTAPSEPESKVLGISADRRPQTDLAQTGAQSGVLAGGALVLVLGGLLLLGVRGRRLEG